jgi:hypothetical protein
VYSPLCARSYSRVADEQKIQGTVRCALRLHDAFAKVESGRQLPAFAVPPLGWLCFVLHILQNRSCNFFTIHRSCRFHGQMWGVHMGVTSQPVLAAAKPGERLAVALRSQSYKAVAKHVQAELQHTSHPDTPVAAPAPASCAHIQYALAMLPAEPTLCCSKHASDILH